MKKDKTGEKKSRKKRKRRGPKGRVPPEMGTKIDFFRQELSSEVVTNEIEAQKKSDFEHPTKTKKMKENERK